MAITLTDNDFFSGLSNLALFMRLYATNTSRKPANFIESFATETLGSGNQKIFPFSDLPSVDDYNPVSTVLTVTKVDTNEETIEITEKKVIPSSYNTYILDMAFTSESGMNQFVGYLLGQMESAKENYMYEQILSDLFSKTFTGADQVKTVELESPGEDMSLMDRNQMELWNNKQIAKTVQLNLSNMQVYNNTYNSKGYTQALALEDLKFIFCEPYHTENLINLYATLLNSSVLENSFDKPTMYTIPEIKMPENDKTIGWIMHKYAYQFFYKFVFMGNFFDVSNLCINNFLHFWFGKGWLDNLPVCKIMVA